MNKPIEPAPPSLDFVDLPSDPNPPQYGIGDERAVPPPPEAPAPPPALPGAVRHPAVAQMVERSAPNRITFAPEAPAPPPIAPPTPVAIERRSAMGDLETESQAESSFVAAQAKALVAARFLVAERRPRDVDECRVRILAACRRPAFARAAEYAKPIGDGKVRGPSIRFAEEALRIWGNVAVDVSAIQEDETKRRIRITATDLETNTTYATESTMAKTVERRSLRPGQESFGQRVNSKGEVTYVVLATEDELLTKTNAAASKMIRGNGLRLIPADIRDEAMATCRAIAHAEDARDPSAARKAVADAFAPLGVMPSDLKEYLGHALEQSAPAELDELRAFYTAIKEGEVTWQEIMKARASDLSPKAETPQEGTTEEGGSIDALKARLAARIKNGRK